MAEDSGQTSCRVTRPGEDQSLRTLPNMAGHSAVLRKQNNCTCHWLFNKLTLCCNLLSLIFKLHVHENHASAGTLKTKQTESLNYHKNRLNKSVMQKMLRRGEGVRTEVKLVTCARKITNVFIRLRFTKKPLPIMDSIPSLLHFTKSYFTQHTSSIIYNSLDSVINFK